MPTACSHSTYSRPTAPPVRTHHGGKPEASLQSVLASSAVSTHFWSHELSCSSLASTDSGYTQQPWLPDELSSHCMQCAAPFHLLRWTHHCRDCGGVYCAKCSAHRVELASALDANAPLAPSLVRLCDGCAFSVHHPHHLGCDDPLRCVRCSPPTKVQHVIVYLRYALQLLFCWPCVADPCMCLATCTSMLDERYLPPLGRGGIGYRAMPAGSKAHHA